MRYRLRDIPRLLETSFGRRQLMHGVRIRLTPVYVWTAVAYRRSVIRKTRMVAVVGSFGKTTTTHCLLSVLAGEAHPNFWMNSGISLAKNILRIHPGEPYAVVEAGISRPGQMDLSARMVKPDIVVATTIGSEHNRSLKTIEATRREKAKMVRALPGTGLAVLNGDDPNIRWMIKTTAAKVVTYGFGRHNRVRADAIRLEWPSGTVFNLRVEDRCIRVRTRLTGRHMLYPILAAAAVANQCGIGLEAIRHRVAQIAPVPGRCQPLALNGGAVLLRDDVKSSLETIDTALDTLAELAAHRKWVVMGEISEPPGSQGEIYKRLGRRIAGIADKAYFICTKRNFQSYRGGAKSAGIPMDRFVHLGTDGLLDAIEALRSGLGPGDVVLLKGRDNQRFVRLALALTGKSVECRIPYCDAKSIVCANCQWLERGWGQTDVLI